MASRTRGQAFSELRVIRRMVLDALDGLARRLGDLRTRRRFEVLVTRGMRIGRDVHLPASTWIDAAHCYLISIGDNCRLGEQCLILAHDAQMDEFLDAGRLGRVTLHPSCQIGARTCIMAGVDIGPRTIVAPNSVVTRTLPPDTVCGGNPARVLATLDEYLAARRTELEGLPQFDAESFRRMSGTPEGRAALAAALSVSGGFVADRGGGSERAG